MVSLNELIEPSVIIALVNLHNFVDIHVIETSLEPTAKFEHEKHSLSVIGKFDQPEGNQSNDMLNEITLDVPPKYFVDILDGFLLITAQNLTKNIQ